MTEKQEKVLAALLCSPTKGKAAAAAGVTVKTLERYLRDPEFAAAYKRAAAGLVEDATRQLQQALSDAVLRLRKIVRSNSEATANQIAAARTLLDYGLRFTEFNDILRELEDSEADDAL